MKSPGNNYQLLLLLFIVTAACFGCKKNDAENKPMPSAPPKAASATKPIQKALSSSTQKQQRVSSVVQNQQSSSRQMRNSAGLDFSNRKDPFKPYVQSAKVKSTFTRNQRADLLPIQSFDTERFRVVGIIVGIKHRQALVVDPNGKGYVVREGMQIGSNSGVITKITPSAVEVVEKIRDDNGKIHKRSIKLTLIRKK